MQTKSYKSVKRARYNMRRKLVAGFGGMCCCCGLQDDDIVYDFHHLDPDSKDFQLSSRIRSWDVVVAEAHKCVMVCVICHRKIHAGTIQVPENATKFDLALVPKIPRSPHPGRTWSVGSRKGIKIKKHPSLAQRSRAVG